MLNHFKQDFRLLRHGRPGRRFIDHYRRHRASESAREAKWKTAACIAGGILLLVVGTLFGFVPGVPGIVFTIPAIGLLVARLKFFARFLDRAELTARQTWNRVRRRHRS